MTKMTATKKAKQAAGFGGMDVPSELEMVASIKRMVEEMASMMTLAKVVHKIDVAYQLGPKEGDPNAMELKQFRAVKVLG